MFGIYTILTLLLVTSSLLPLAPINHWVIRVLDFPRLQFLVAVVILFILGFLFLDFSLITRWVLMALLLIAIAIQTYWVLPYSPLYPTQVQTDTGRPGAPKIRLMTANVLMHNRNAQKLIALVYEYDPDILVILESNDTWENQLMVLELEYPHTIKCAKDNLYGMHVYSKMPIKNSQIKYLVEEDKPSIHGQINLDGKHDINVHFMHPAPPSPTENRTSTERDAELLVLARSLGDRRIPTIVAGDLNDVAWSRTTLGFLKVSGLLDPRIGRGMFNTFHARFFFLRWPLDHLFHSDHFFIKRIERLESIGSDHFPLLTELSFQGAIGSDQESLDAEREDFIWAKEKSREGDVSPGDVPSPSQP